MCCPECIWPASGVLVSESPNKRIHTKLCHVTKRHQGVMTVDWLRKQRNLNIQYLRNVVLQEIF